VSVLLIFAVVLEFVENTTSALLHTFVFGIAAIGTLSLGLLLARALTVTVYKIKRKIHTRSWNFINKVSFISAVFGIILVAVQIFSLEKYSRQLFGTSQHFAAVPSNSKDLEKYTFLTFDKFQVQFSKRTEYMHLNKSNKGAKQSITAVAYPIITDSNQIQSDPTIWVGYTYYGEIDTKFEDFRELLLTKKFMVEMADMKLFNKAVVSTYSTQNIKLSSIVVLHPIESKEENVFAIHSTILVVYSFVDLLFVVVLFLYSKRMVYARKS